MAYGYPAGAASHDPVVAVVTALQRDVTDADEKLKRLYKLVEDGITELDDVLKDRLNSLKADRDRAKAALERARSHSSQGAVPGSDMSTRWRSLGELNPCFSLERAAS